MVKNKFKIMVIVGVIIVVAASMVFISNFTGSFVDDTGPGNYDDFAKCLTENGVKMYGAYWCSHCNNQKEMFGDSWKYVNYIECSLPNRAGQTQACKEAGITAYPTWEFQDGKRAVAALSIEQLSQYSGCQLDVE